jgi:folate-binding protein YgfZ
MSQASSTTNASPLPYTVLDIRGEDAQAFLQGQFTNSLTKLKPLSSDGQTVYQRSGYCSAKGRLLAIFRCWQAEPGVYRLLLPTDLADALAKRLRMFVLRAKVTIERSAAQVYGLQQPGAGSLVGDPQSAQALQLDQPAQGVTRLVQPGAVTGPGAGSAGLAWLVVEECGISSLSAAAVKPDQSCFLTPQAWQWHQTALGEPWVVTASQDRFVPQSINFELLDGVDFQKGCYPGQEVVARSQYLGKLKTRLFVMQAEQDPSSLALGSDVWLSPEAPIGELVQMAADPEGRIHLVLVSLDLVAWKAATEAGEALWLGGDSAGQGISLRPLEQPYPVPLEPNQPVRPKLN